MEEYVPRILVIDDEVDTLRLLQFTLESAGYQVTTAASGLEGVTELEQREYDVILLDLMMPVQDGYEVLQAIKVGFRRPPPIIVLSAKSTFDDQIQARELGAVDYLVKPTLKENLINAVENALDLVF